MTLVISRSHPVGECSKQRFADYRSRSMFHTSTRASDESQNNEQMASEASAYPGTFALEMTRRFDSGYRQKTKRYMSSLTRRPST